MCAAADPALSLITLDLGLPDGHDLTQALRGLSPAPLLFLTVRAEGDDILSGLAAGAAAYLTRPFRPGNNVAKKLPQQALTKEVIYPIVKKVAGYLGCEYDQEAQRLSPVFEESRGTRMAVGVSPLE